MSFLKRECRNNDIIGGSWIKSRAEMRVINAERERRSKIVHDYDATHQKGGSMFGNFFKGKHQVKGDRLF